MVKKEYYGNECFGLPRDPIKVRQIGPFSTTYPMVISIVNVKHFLFTSVYSAAICLLTPHTNVNILSCSSILLVYPMVISTYCLKSFLSRSFSGPHFPAFGLNTGKYIPEKLRIRTLSPQ